MPPPTPPNPFTTTTDVSHPGHYQPHETALLLLDFHKSFVQRAAGPSGPTALHTAAHTRTWALSQGIHVIHCLIDVAAGPFATCKDFARFEATVAAMRADSGVGGEADALHGGGDVDVGDATATIREGEGGEGGREVTFTRRPGHVSALKSPGLEDYLHAKGIKSLVLTGLSTSGCVLRTGIAACDAEYVVTTLADACADADREVHELVVGRLLTNRGYVCTAREWREGYAAVMGAEGSRGETGGGGEGEEEEEEGQGRRRN